MQRSKACSGGGGQRGGGLSLCSRCDVLVGQPPPRGAKPVIVRREPRQASAGTWHWATVGMALGHCGHGTGPRQAAQVHHWRDQRSGSMEACPATSVPHGTAYDYGIEAHPAWYPTSAAAARIASTPTHAHAAYDMPRWNTRQNSRRHALRSTQRARAKRIVRPATPANSTQQTARGMQATPRPTGATLLNRAEARVAMMSHRQRDAASHKRTSAKRSCRTGTPRRRAARSKASSSPQPRTRRVTPAAC